VTALPAELWGLVLKRLEWAERLAVASTCRRFYAHWKEGRRARVQSLLASTQVVKRTNLLSFSLFNKPPTWLHVLKVEVKRRDVFFITFADACKRQRLRRKVLFSANGDLLVSIDGGYQILLF
jgi:hypothetical protein